MSQILLTDVRKKFLEYFKKNNHNIVESSNLVPNNDPTLMFTNSGMVQFKNVFTGLEKKPYKKATTSQKCVRAGGKHNDLENVGYTPRHHTFFEMLGNFSFGDYFKEQAIYHAWNLLTKDFQLSKDKLLVTVFHEDDESYNLWKKIAGFSENKIIKISTADNFWSMGDTGPCGPCSEIFYDHGEKLKGGPPGSSDEDGDRFIEIWNLVFMQYEQISKEKRIDLPKPSVDTGMGLERMTAVLQGTHDNYEIDHFKKIMSSSAEYIKTPISKKTIASHRVIADHLRASSFLIAEGILPSNEGRGYVLRRIMRRGMRHAHSLGSKTPIFHKLFDVLLNEMKNSYPELSSGKDLIVETLKNEEEKFSSLLERGMKILDENLSKVKSNTLPGSVAFKLYDTYGFPVDLTADILRTKNIKVDNSSFEKQMEERQKEFFSMHKRQLPEEINFRDVERDTPIENIDSLMTQKLNERKYDTPIDDASLLDNDTIDVVSSEQSDVKMIKKDNIQWLNQIHDTNINETPIFEPRTNETMNNTLATQLQAAEKIIEQLNTIQMQNYDSMNQTLLSVMERLTRAEEMQKEILQKVDLLQDKVEI